MCEGEGRLERSILRKVGEAGVRLPFVKLAAAGRGGGWGFFD